MSKSEKQARYASVLVEVFQEIGRAREKFGPFQSRHEAYAVILEDMDELWDLIKIPKEHASSASMAAEAIQVAAMAACFVVECCPGVTDGLVQKAPKSSDMFVDSKIFEDALVDAVRATVRSLTGDKR